MIPVNTITYTGYGDFHTTPAENQVTNHHPPMFGIWILTSNPISIYQLSDINGLFLQPNSSFVAPEVTQRNTCQDETWECLNEASIWSNCQSMPHKTMGRQTLPETNLALENTPFAKGNQYSTNPFSGAIC